MKKLALFLVVALMLSVISCTKPAATTTPNEIDTNNETVTPVGDLKAVVEDFLANVQVTEAPEKEYEKDDTPITDVFEVPYQYDLNPYIELAKEDYTGIELTKMSAEVTADDVIESINADLSNFTELVDITDRGAEMGDTLDINFKGFESGVAFEGGTAENFEMVLGQAGFIDGFEDQLVGHKVGEEFTIDVVFPEDYSEPLAGKPAQFEIKINSIKAAEQVPLTDEFVKENLFCDSLNDYLLQKYKEVNESMRIEAENVQKSLAYSLVYENAQIKEIPADRFAIYYTRVVDDAKNTASAYGMEFESFLSQAGMDQASFEEYASQQATAIVEQELVAFSIANAEGLWQKLTKTDYNKYLDTLAASYGTDAQTFEGAYGSEMIWNSLILEEVINFVIANAVIK